MTTFLSKEVRDGIAAAQRAAAKRKSRLRVVQGDQSFKILRKWSNGFALDADSHAPMRGLVDLYDGGTHLGQCLIVAAELVDGELKFEFKRNTAAQDQARLDFYREPNAPIALLGN